MGAAGEGASDPELSLRTEGLPFAGRLPDLLGGDRVRTVEWELSSVLPGFFVSPAPGRVRSKSADSVGGVVVVVASRGTCPENNIIAKPNGQKLNTLKQLLELEFITT